ncbi:hypothetical protein ACS0TY_021475 [Phlomoides rotata]
MKSLNSKHQVRIGREMQGFDGSPSFGSFSKRVSTIARNGKAGFMDGSALEAQLSEPSGLIEVGNGNFLLKASTSCAFTMWLIILVCAVGSIRKRPYNILHAWGLQMMMLQVLSSMLGELLARPRFMFALGPLGGEQALSGNSLWVSLWASSLLRVVQPGTSRAWRWLGSA